MLQELKLVIGLGRQSEVAKLEWPVGDISPTWLSMWWEPTEEDYLRFLGKKLTWAYRGGVGKQLRDLVSEIIPEKSIVYAGLDPLLGEGESIIRDLESRGLAHEQIWKPHPISNRKKVLHQNPAREVDFVFAEADKKFVVECFHYGSWQATSWFFLITREPLSDWTKQLAFLRGTRVITKELLSNIDFFLTNHYEHGFDILSSKFEFDQAREIAERAANAVGWKLESRTALPSENS